MTPLCPLGYKIASMLRSLTVRNYTLIDALETEFEGGLTIITGETGAGKSIVLDALGLALGNRADLRALRAGADRLEVSAVFELSETPAAVAWLAARELDQGDECQLRRVATRDGRSRAWINGQPVTLQDMKELGDQLVDMHGQHEHHSLLSRGTQQRLLDAYGGHGDLVEAVREAYRQWKDCNEELSTLRENASERNDRRQLLEYQLREMHELALEEGELEQLEQNQRMLANASELSTELDAAIALCEDEDSGGLLNLLRQLDTIMARLAELGDQAANAQQLLDSALIQVEEARHDLLALRDNLEINPARLDQVESRLSAIHRLARKHRVDAGQLLVLQQQLETETAELQGSDIRLDSMDKHLLELQSTWTGAASLLSAARHKAAKDIADRVQEQLALLGMQSCRFEVAFKAASNTPSVHGAEQLEFLVSTNPGTTPEPLARIASGGELSRISLAIQVITATRAVTPTVIFDEVDVGVGGATADAVGILLQSLGLRTQVLCVTHLPQVAARGHHHLLAVKNSSAESTQAQLIALAHEARIGEIARMLGGMTITSKTLDHASEMLSAAHTSA